MERKSSILKGSLIFVLAATLIISIIFLVYIYIITMPPTDHLFVKIILSFLEQLSSDSITRSLREVFKIRSVEDLYNIANAVRILLIAILLIIFILVCAAVAISESSSEGKEKFSDIDTINDTDKQFYYSILKSIESLDKSKKEAKSENKEENFSVLLNKTTELIEIKINEDNELDKSFNNYFLYISRRLERQINLCDMKSSILLDRGTGYAKFGISFFIITTILWQVICFILGFREHIIFGITSFAILFIFIEFMSAWFLKQYKNYVDTSTYIIKIKSIFDKYMLCNLITTGPTYKKATHDNLLQIIGSDIKWPDTYLLKTKEIGFAREAMESMSVVLEAIKSHAKTVCGKDAERDKKHE